jgi:hypothetical protein
MPGTPARPLAVQRVDRPAPFEDVVEVLELYEAHRRAELVHLAVDAVATTVVSPA